MKKRRFAEGGFSDIDEGRDTPDQALARKASMSPMAASDKAAGLASTKGQDVGLKRLFMGNIDKPDSEAGQQFGAGKARLDRMPAAPDRSESMKNTSGFDAPISPFRPRPPFTIPSTPIDMAESPMLTAGTPTGPGKYKRDTEGEATSELARESRKKTPANAPVRRTNPSISASDKPMPSGPMGNTNPRDAERGMSRGTRNTNIDMAEGPTYNGPRTGPEKKTSAPKAEIPTAGASKAPASTGEDTSGPSNIERILMATGVGAGAVGLGAAGARGVKAYKAAQRAKELDAAKQFSQPVAKEVAKNISKYTPKQELEAGTSALRGKLTRKGIQERNPDSKVEYKRGGSVKKYASGGSVSSRGDGIAQRGKTKGKMV